MQGGKIEKQMNNLRDLWNDTKISNICGMKFSKGVKKYCAEGIFEEIMAEKPPKFGRAHKLTDSEVEQIPNRKQMNKEIHTQMHHNQTAGN